MFIVIDIPSKWNTNISIEPRLYVTDEPERIRALSMDGHPLCPILNDNTRDMDLSAFPYLITDPEAVDTDFYIKVWQRLASLPWEIALTPRCRIREMTEDDVEALYRIYSDESIVKYTEPLFPDYESEREYTRNYIRNVYSYFGFGTWIIEELDTGDIIGRAGFNYRTDEDLPDTLTFPELGYVIGKEYQGRGYATEVCLKLIALGFEELGFDCIQALSHPDNHPSIRLLSSLGFEYYGVYGELNIYKKKAPT